MQWAEGQAKVLLTFLLIASFYLGFKGRTALSGVAFGLGAFDPRFSVLALPLFLFYNKNKLKPALSVMVAVFALSKRYGVLPRHSSRLPQYGFILR